MKVGIWLHDPRREGQMPKSKILPLGMKINQKYLSDTLGVEK